MIYLVSGQESLFNNSDGWTSYQRMSLEDSIKILNSLDVIQFDLETDGRNAHLCSVLMAQFGSRERNMQIVVDCTTIDLTRYKEIIETKLIIGQNLKFDYQFLFKYGIIPSKTWDTMIVEQLLYLGYSYKPVSPAEYQKYDYDFPYHDNGFYTLSFALDALVEKYVHQHLDKSIRGEIIWRGIDTSTIIYGARDVTYLEDIKEQQEEILKKRNCIPAAEIENAFVVVIAYLEWCGIKLDVNKWKLKMQKDLKNLETAKNALDDYIVELSKSNPELKKYVYVNTQGDLFSGFDTKPKCTINWQSQKQTIPLYKLLGFDTTVQDKETGENKDSAMEKHLIKQKGIDDYFLKLMFGKDEFLPDGTMNHYWGYQESAKVCSTYGEVYLDAINPITGRIHTKFNQLGATSGRMSCGGGQKDFDTDLAKYKGLPASRCKFVQIQNLPADHETRESFICEDGNLMCSCDYAALELKNLPITIMHLFT